MKDYYVCLPKEPLGQNVRVVDRYLCGYSDNEFVFRQYIIKSHPILQHILGEKYCLILLKYSVDSLSELFDIVKEEYGYHLTEGSEIVSLYSNNNPNLSIYMSYDMYSDGCGILVDPHSIIDTFLQILWTSMEWYKISEACIKLPNAVQDMMQLIYDKYMALIFALCYSDIESWQNNSLRDNIVRKLPNHHNGSISVYDITDDVMMWLAYGDWSVERENNEEGGDG